MLKGRERWFADVIQAGLETRVLVEPELLVHATPAILAKTMPRDVLVRMFEGALTSGTISPEAIVQTITPELLAEHVAPSVVWECIVTAAERADIDQGTKDSEARDWLRRSVESALRNNVLTPAHLMRHVDAKVLVNHLPDDLTAKLIEASLAAGKMTPELIIDVLGVEPITSYSPTNVVWDCISEVGEGVVARVDVVHAAPEPAKTTAKRFMVDDMDDDMVSMTIDEPGENTAITATGSPAVKSPTSLAKS